MLKRLFGVSLILTAMFAVESMFTPLLQNVPYGFKIAAAALALAAGLYCALSKVGKTSYRYDFQEKRAKEDAQYQAKNWQK